jgi:hypothetical protein
MTDSARLNFDPGREQVEAMMAQGLSFSAVEDAIDAAQLSVRHKAALWLLAWSLRDQAQQRRDARRLLAEVSVER